MGNTGTPSPRQAIPFTANLPHRYLILSISLRKCGVRGERSQACHEANADAVKYSRRDNTNAVKAWLTTCTKLLRDVITTGGITENRSMRIHRFPQKIMQLPIFRLRKQTNPFHKAAIVSLMSEFISPAESTFYRRPAIGISRGTKR